MDKTQISWCDGTLNWWEGCAKLSDGCKNCYAELRDIRFSGGEHWGKGAPRKKSKSALKLARRYSDKAKKGFFVRCTETGLRGWLGADHLPADTVKAIARPTFFSLSLGDILDDEIDPLWLAEALNAAILADGIDFMFLTKRPGAWHDAMSLAYLAAKKDLGDAAADRLKQWMTGERIPSNIAWGATIENAKVAARFDELLAIPVVRRFASMEPLLGPPDWLHGFKTHIERIDLVIVGGESTTKARPMFIEWPLIIEAICDEVGTAFHFKQWGEWVPSVIEPFPAGKPVVGNMLRVRDTGDAYGPREVVQAPNATVWRAGTEAAGHTMPPDHRGKRERREILSFPGDLNRMDWHHFEGLPGIGLRAQMFTSRQSAADFINAHPSAAPAVWRWDPAESPPPPPMRRKDFLAR